MMYIKLVVQDDVYKISTRNATSAATFDQNNDRISSYQHFRYRQASQEHSLCFMQSSMKWDFLLQVAQTVCQVLLVSKKQKNEL